MVDETDDGRQDLAAKALFGFGGGLYVLGPQNVGAVEGPFTQGAVTAGLMVLGGLAALANR